MPDKTQLFFLQSTARSGTAWLGSYLSAHPEIEWLGEMFHPALFANGYYSSLAKQIATDPAAILPHNQSSFCADYLSGLSSQSASMCGVDLKLEHMLQLPYIHECIYRQPFKFITLRRLNLLKQAVSELLMYERIKRGDGEIHRNYVPEKVSIWIEPDMAMGMMAAKDETTEKYNRRIAYAGSPCLSLVYEDMCLPGGIEQALCRIEGFLKIGGFSKSGAIVKQNPFPVDELVANWNELSRAIAQSKFAYTLHLPG